MTQSTHRQPLTLPRALLLLSLVSASLSAAAQPAVQARDDSAVGVALLGRAQLAPRPVARAPRLKRQNLISALAAGGAQSAQTAAAADTAAAASGGVSAPAATGTTAAPAGNTASAVAPAGTSDAGTDAATTNAPAASAGQSTDGAAPPATTSDPTTAGTPSTATSATTPVSSNTNTKSNTKTTASTATSSGSTSSGTSSTSSASSTATAAAKKDNSSSTGKTWGIVGGVAGGVVGLLAIAFVAWKCSQRRFSSIEDGPDIRWPELQADSTTLNPSATHRTGGAGFEMGERGGRASDEWDAHAPFNAERQSMMGYNTTGLSESQHYPATAYDPYGGGAGLQNAYPPAQGQMYPPPTGAQQPGGGGRQSYFDPYGQPAFATSQASYHSGAPPYGAHSPYADDEKEEVARAGTPQGARGADMRTNSQVELDHITLGNRSQPQRQGTGFSEKAL